MAFNREKSAPIALSESEAAELSPPTERGLLDYARNFRLAEDEFAGKQILDLGSGPTAKFERDVKAKFPESLVVSMDYAFDIDPENRPTRGAGPEPQPIDGEPAEHRVAALFERLPFKDESFDIVVSSAAMPLYLNSAEQIEAAFSEVIRVLRKGGKFYGGPVQYTDIISTEIPDDFFAQDFDGLAGTHRKHTYEESKALIQSILREKFQKILHKEIDVVFLDEEYEQYRQGKFRQTHPSMMLITKLEE